MKLIHLSPFLRTRVPNLSLIDVFSEFWGRENQDTVSLLYFQTREKKSPFRSSTHTPTDESSTFFLLLYPPFSFSTLLFPSYQDFFSFLKPRPFLPGLATPQSRTPEKKKKKTAL